MAASQVQFLGLPLPEIQKHLGQVPGGRLGTEYLLELLRESHPVYSDRSTAQVARIRGQVLLTLADRGLPDEAVAFAIEEYTSGMDAYAIACAAVAFRSGRKIRALGELSIDVLQRLPHMDRNVDIRAIAPSWPLTEPTSATVEVLRTLAWYGPAGRTILPTLRDMVQHPEALSSAAYVELQQALAAIEQPDSQTVGKEDCCDLPCPWPQHHVRFRCWRRLAVKDLVLQDQFGNRTRLGTWLRNKPTVVAFFYTRCDNPYKCSLTISALAVLQQRLVSVGIAEHVNIAAITYDPEFDCAERLRDYCEGRGVHFADNVRAFRAQGKGLTLLQNYLGTEVSYAGTLVTRHRVEVFMMDGSGRVAHSFTRQQLDAEEMLSTIRRCCEGSELSSKSAIGFWKITRSFISTRLASLTLTALIAVFPKCPLCLAAYLSAFGASVSVSHFSSGSMAAILFVLVSLNLAMLGYRARHTGRFLALVSGILGACALLIAYLTNVSSLLYVGASGLVLASLLNALPARTLLYLKGFRRSSLST